MPRSANMPRIVFFGRQTDFAQWEAEHPEARDARRANLPSSFRALTLGPDTEAVDQLPNTWPHWGALIDWLGNQELSDSMMALLRRARVVNGVAIPSRGGGETVQLDLSTDAAPASIHTLFFGNRQRYLEYARSLGRRFSVPRSAVIHVNSVRDLTGITIAPDTVVESHMIPNDPHWHEFLDHMQQLLVRSTLSYQEAHPSVRNFMDTALRYSTVRVVYIGNLERYNRWRRENQYNAELSDASIIHIDDPRATRALRPAFHVSRFTELIDQTASDFVMWFDLHELLREMFAQVDAPHRTVVRMITRCRDMVQRQVDETPVRITSSTGFVTVGGGSGGGTDNLNGSQQAQRRIDELEYRVALLQRALDQIAEDSQRPDAYRLVAAHARRVAEGEHILWLATSDPANYRLISIGEHGNADTLATRWNTEHQRWEAIADELWVRR